MTSSEKTTNVLKYCPNYDFIVAFDINANDNITKQLIDCYRDYIFNMDEKNKEDLNLIQQFDLSIFEYINNNKFFKKVQDHFSNNEDITIIEFNKLYLAYQDNLLNDITNTKWI